MSKQAHNYSCENLRMSGTVKVGEKWQIVIPADVREELSITPGDTLQVVVKSWKAIGLIKTSNMVEFMEYLTQEIKTSGYLDREQEAIEVIQSHYQS
jgi:AbrB family looped-hinge helix DNA binding protein